MFIWYIQQVWSVLPIRLCLVFIILSLGKVKGAREVKYVGCMKRTSGSMSFSEKVKTEGVQVKDCVHHCWERRRKFAGLQSGSQCYCSATLSDVVTVAERECYKRCNKNCQQMCGGETTLSVYNTGYIREPAAPMKKKALIKANIGCYKKYRSLQVLCPKEFAPLQTTRMTVQMCVYYCASVHKAKFSTTTDKETCCCSNSVSGAPNTRLDWCNMHCRGDTAKTMGCIGIHRGELLVATIQISRLPEFKRWPTSTFTSADWLAPIYPVGEKFEVKDKPVASLEDDPSLSGLLAKKVVNERVVGNVSVAVGVALVGDQAVVSLEGGDKRDKTLGGVGNSVAVSEVSGRAESAMPDKNEGNKIIIAVVAVSFVMILIATGFYFFSSRNTNSEDDDEDDEDEDKRPKKKSKKKRKSSLDEEDEDLI